jgi:hypothetical protein
VLGRHSPECQESRPCLDPEDGRHLIHEDALIAEYLSTVSSQFFHPFRSLDVLRGPHVLDPFGGLLGGDVLHPLDGPTHRPDLLDRVDGLVESDDRLDSERAPEKGFGAPDPAALLEVVEGLDEDPVLLRLRDRFGPLDRTLDAEPLPDCVGSGQRGEGQSSGCSL